MQINYRKMSATAENRGVATVSLAFLQPGKHTQRGKCQHAVSIGFNYCLHLVLNISSFVFNFG